MAYEGHLGPAEYAQLYRKHRGYSGYRSKQGDLQRQYAAVARDAGKSGAEIYHPDYISPETGQNAREQFTLLQQGIVLPRIPVPPGAGIKIPEGQDSAKYLTSLFANSQSSGQPSGQSSGNRGLPMPAAASTPAYSTPYSEPAYSTSYSDRAHAAITTPRYAGNYSSVPENMMPSWMRGGSAPAPAQTENKGLLPALDREHSSVPEHLMPEWLRGRSSGISDMIPPEWRGSTSGE